MAPGTIWPLLPHGHSPTRSWAQPFPSRAAPRAKSCVVQGAACPVPFCPTGTACPIHLCPMSRACPGPPLSHGHSLLHPMAEHHLPGHSSAPSPSVPWAQPTRCPLPGTTGTTCLMGTACCIPPPQGHSAHRGASPSRGVQGARGCGRSPRLGARPPLGARGRGAASAAGPVCRGAGVGCGAAARGLAPRSCTPGGSQLPTWEERGEIWGAVAGDIGEGGPWGGRGGGGGRRRPTVSCLYERTVQTTCREKDRQTDGRRERESKEMGQSLLSAAVAGLGHQGTGTGGRRDGRQH